MKRWMALLLSVLLLVSLTACGQRGIEGVWKGQVNLTGVMQEQWEKSTERFPELREELEIEAVPVYITMEFREDGTCTVDVDDDSLAKFFTQTREQWKAVLGAGLGSVDKLPLPEGLGELLDLPLGALEGVLGLTMDALLGDAVQQAIAAGIDREGNYMEKDGQLYISNDPATPAENDKPCKYTLEKDTLTIQAWSFYAGETLGEVSFPLVLKRQ